MSDEAAFGHWLAGFIDGRGGSFMLPDRDGRIRPQFKLGMRAEDRALLDWICEETRAGRVAVSQRRDKTRVPRATWIVDQKEDCLRLVHLLDQFPMYSEKAGDYQIWRNAVIVWEPTVRGRGATEKNIAMWREMQLLALDLRERQYDLLRHHANEIRGGL